MPYIVKNKKHMIKICLTSNIKNIKLYIITLKEENMNRSDIMRISALFEIALGSASLIAARFWIGTTNIVGRHVSHGDTTEAFALTYAFTLLQIAIGL